MNKLVFNIETIPDSTLPAEILPKMDDFEAPGTWKDVAKINAYKQEKVEEAIAKMSLNPLTAKIICLSMIYQEDGTVVTYGPTFGEREIVIAFWANFGQMHKSGGMLVGYNSKAFDLPMLINAAIRYELDLANQGVHFGGLGLYTSKYDQSSHFDVMTFLMNFELKKGNLGDWSQRMGGARPFGKGNMVNQWYREQNYDNITHHCHDNVALTNQLYTKITTTFGMPA